MTIALLDEALEENLDEEETLSAIDEIGNRPTNRRYIRAVGTSFPARPEKLHVPTGSLDAYFTQLSLIEDGTDKVARALVWGDSTIASDGIIKDVRGRMQERFGDAGPGFLSCQSG